MKKNKIISMILIILGILVISYPRMAEKYNDSKQDEILKQWEEDMKNLEYIDEPSEEELEEEEETKLGDLEGVMEIDKIDLKLPILTGAIHENMKTSVASIEHTGKLGQVGNYGIAGHRNLTYGRNFNRLDEVELGDKIKVTDNNGKEYIYEVFDKLYVYPKDTWVLNPSDDNREITLVTCHPIGSSTHRLIIKGKIKE